MEFGPEILHGAFVGMKSWENGWFILKFQKMWFLGHPTANVRTM